MKQFLGGAYRDISAGTVFKGGSWRSFAAGNEYNSAAWRDIVNFTPAGPSGGGGGTLTLTVDPNPCGRVGASSTITTPNCTVTPSGGQTPYTYSWSITAGGPVTINTPHSAFTSFTKTNVPLFQELDAVAKCDVTDSLGVSASITVSLFFEHENSGTQ